MIGLMDCNNFFVSCERLFRPDLSRKPVLVLSSNDGCVVSRSQEVKDMGISMGVPFFQIREVCEKEKVTAFSSNFTLYKDISSRVMAALREEFPLIEVYSIDEAFFEVDDSCTEEELMGIRARIIQKTGIPISIGVAETKTLAKIAGADAKKGTGIFIMRPVDRLKCIEERPCGMVWGIGRQLTQSLTREHVHTIGDFLSLDAAFVSQRFGIIGSRLRMELGGQVAHPIGMHALHEHQSITSTRSFGSVVKKKSELISAITFHVTQVSEKLRARAEVASRLTVILKAGRFSEYAYREGSLTIDLDTPTNDVLGLVKEAVLLVERMFDSEVPYKKAGVIVSGIVPEVNTSNSLFAHQDVQHNSKKLNGAIDALNAQFGKGVVKVASGLSGGNWNEKKKVLSKEYTTKWSDIPTVKAL